MESYSPFVQVPISHGTPRCTLQHQVRIKPDGRSEELEQGVQHVGRLGRHV